MVEVSLNEAIGNFMDPAGHSSRNQILRHLNQELGKVKRKIVPLEQHPTLESVRNLFERAVKINNDIKATTEMGDSLAISHDDDQLRMEAQRAVEKIEDIAANQGITLRQAEAAPAPAEPSALRSLEEAKKAPSSGKISFSEKIASMDGTTPAREIQQMFTQAHQQQDQIRQDRKKGGATRVGFSRSSFDAETKALENLDKLYGAIGKMKSLAKQKGITLTKPDSSPLTNEQKRGSNELLMMLKMIILPLGGKIQLDLTQLEKGLKRFLQSGDYSDLFDGIENRMDAIDTNSEEYGHLLIIKNFLINVVTTDSFQGKIVAEGVVMAQWQKAAMSSPADSELLAGLKLNLEERNIQEFDELIDSDMNMRRNEFFSKMIDGNSLLRHVKLSEIHSFYYSNYKDIDTLVASITKYPGMERDLAIWREALEQEKVLNPLRKEISEQLTEYSKWEEASLSGMKIYEPGEDLSISCPMQIIGKTVTIYFKGKGDRFYLHYHPETGTFTNQDRQSAKLSNAEKMRYLKQIKDLVSYAKEELSIQCLTNLASTKMALSAEYFASSEQKQEEKQVTSYHFDYDGYIYTPDSLMEQDSATIIRKIDEGNSIAFTISPADGQEITYNPQLGIFTSSDGEAIAFSKQEEVALYRMLQLVLEEDRAPIDRQLIEDLGEIFALENTDFSTEIFLDDTLYDLDLHTDFSGTASLTFFEKGEGRKNLGRVEISGAPERNVTFFPSAPQNLRALKSLCMQSTTDLPKLVALDMRKKIEEKSHVLDCMGLASGDFNGAVTVAHRKQEIAGHTMEMFELRIDTYPEAIILKKSDALTGFTITDGEIPLELLSKVLNKLQTFENALDEVERTIQFTKELAPGQKLDNPYQQQYARFLPSYELGVVENGAMEFSFAYNNPDMPGGKFFIVEVEGVLKFYLDAQLTTPVTDPMEIRSLNRQLSNVSPKFHHYGHIMVINQLDLALRSNPLGSLSTYARGWTGAAPYPRIFNMQSPGADGGGPTQDLLTKAMPIWLEAARKAPEAEKKKAFEDIGTILVKSHGHFLVPRDPAFSQIGSLSRVTRDFSAKKTEVDRELISHALKSPKNAPKTQSGNMLQTAMLYNEMIEDIDGVLSETEKQLAGNATVGAIGFVGFFGNVETANLDAELISDGLEDILERPPVWEGHFEDPEFDTVAGLMEFCKNPENKAAVVEYCKRQKAIVIGDLIINNETREEVEVLAKAMLKQDPDFASKVEKEDFNDKLMVRLAPKEVAAAFLQLSVSNTTGDPQVQQKLRWISQWIARGGESNAAGVKGLDAEETEKLLMFITGAPSLPLQPIKIHKTLSPNGLPSSQSCFQTLQLGTSKVSEQKFREQLALSLANLEGYQMA